MRRLNLSRGLAYVVLIVLVLSTRTSLVSSSEPNATQVTLEDEADELLSKMTLAEFKERYRRLIPYMTFYVANNYVSGQTPVAQNNPKSLPTSPSIRTHQQPSFPRLATMHRRGGNKYHITAQNQEKKFIPSVQYDPNNVGSDNDYFTPMRYNSKVTYDDYSLPYQIFQSQKVYPEITTPSQVTQKENRYFVRPLQLFPTSRDHLPRKQAKPVHPAQEDYIVDYNSRPSGTSVINYPIKDFQGFRYIPSPAYPKVQQPIKILDQVQGIQPAISQVARNPNIKLNQIVESFQLSERLPEMLNKDNIDNSLKTLVEILNILHNSKKEESSQVQVPQLVQLVPPVLSFQQKGANYNNFKLRQPTAPKVITETRFQATPNPLYLTEDPERYKVTYVNDESSKVPPQPNYETNNLNNNKIVEYYTPVVQEIPVENKEVFQPTVKPQVNSDTTQHSYEITEDLEDDVLDSDRYTSPVTTEKPISSFTEPNEITPPEFKIPKTQLKYGATRGKPNVHYPAYAKIPQTDFSCKEQRYKGFFGDPATGCQVWHYCDLNGGKASFLCPNGTIFSQVALTCDWWFNVKCETTTQLYVLNERLYKYILPIMPKFPEDFTGPEVDRYLELKFKEMEAKLREKKLKKQQEEKEKLKTKLQALNEKK